MNNNKQTGRFSVVVVLTFLTLTFSFCGVVKASNIKDSTRTFPLLPASFEELEYKGMKGCMPSDTNYYFAVSENEGLVSLGALSFLETPNDGAHSLLVAIHETKRYAYLLMNKADGMFCISEKLKTLKIKNTINVALKNSTHSLKLKDCNFTKRYSKQCGTYSRLVTDGLQKNGFKLDWQAEKTNGNFLTLLSGKGKTYLLTTNKNTGATVITGKGEDEFSFINIPE
jgi:hypothetical protein